MTVRAACGWLGQVASWLVILGVTAVIAAAIAVPAMVGATTYTVLTGSMRPGLPEGTLVISRPTPTDDIGVGDVVTYQLRSGRPEVVTHRVVAVAVGDDGEPLFRTQGDANDAVDPDWVRPVQVKGTVWYAVPWAGRVRVLTGDRRQLAVYVVSAALLGYAAYMFTCSLRDRKRRAAGAPEAASETVADETSPIK